MKITKKARIISMLLSGVMALSSFGSLAVYAEETVPTEEIIAEVAAENKTYTYSELEAMSHDEFYSVLMLMSAREFIHFCNSLSYEEYISLFNDDDVIEEPVAEKKPIYTFKELSDMSDKEFLSLDEEALNCYISILGFFKREPSDFRPEYRQYLTFSFMFNTYTSPTYEYGKTEDLVYELFGDEVKFDLRSPINCDENVYYSFIFSVSNDEYTYYEEEVTEERLMFFVKALYCLKQANSKFQYYPFEATLASNSSIGDANSDNKLDIADAAFIAKKVAKRKTNELTSEADFNYDGKIDIRDAATIAKFIAVKQAYKLKHQ